MSRGANRRGRRKQQTSEQFVSKQRDIRKAADAKAEDDTRKKEKHP